MSQTISSSSSATLTLTSGYNPLSITASGTVSGAPVGIYGSAGTAWYIINQGTVAAQGINTGGPSTGILFEQGGTVTNSGYITGYGGGIFIGGSAGTVTNAGTITGPGSLSVSGVGVNLQAGGAVDNTVNTATISGGTDGIDIAAGTGTVSNSGLVKGSRGYGVDLTQGGFVTNYQGATIYGFTQGVYVGGGTTTLASGTVVSLGTGTVVNLGTVIGDQNSGIVLQDGGLVVNGTSGASASTAYISGASNGVYLNFADQTAVDVPATLVNYGTITGGGNAAGVLLGDAGTVFNGPGATINGGSYGADLDANHTTLINAGTIIATSGPGLAVQSVGDYDAVIVDPGGTFVGHVFLGGGAHSYLGLGSGSGAGTLTGLGGFASNFYGFATLDVADGANWTLTGSNAVNASTPIVIGNGADLDVTGTLTGGANFAVDGGALTLTNALSSGDSFNMASTGTAGPGTITLDAVTGTTLSNTITDFGPLDEIVLPGVTFATGSTATYGGNTLSVSLASGGTFTFENFTLAAGASTTFNVGANTVQNALCFLAGTPIATPSGEVLVERLTVGDNVVTASGEIRRIAWIGVGRVLATRGQRTAATPVIVCKGALADNVPNRDLRVTKGHSLLIDGVLIPVEFLVNHRSIIWDDRAQEVSIYHVELDTHDVLLAAGAPAESYRDDGNRWLFRNANSGWDDVPKPPCAPVLTGGPIVDAIWRRLLDRAGPRPGLPLTDDPDLNLVVDGSRLDAAVFLAGRYVFRLARRPRELRLVSRAGAPAELGLSRDSRMLGVAVRRIVLAEARHQRAIQSDAAVLRDGYHQFEAENGYRWTDGDAAIPAELFSAMRGPAMLIVELGATTRYLDHRRGSEAA